MSLKEVCSELRSVWEGKIKPTPQKLRAWGQVNLGPSRDLGPEQPSRAQPATLGVRGAGEQGSQGGNPGEIWAGGVVRGLLA